MDKKQQIEEMAKAIPDMVQLGSWAFDLTSTYTPQQAFLKKKAIAYELVNVGYGNLKEFARFIKSKLFDLGNVVTEPDIDDLLKEYLNG